MARCPSLDDYDRNNHLLHWAETVARIAHPSYDEYFASEWTPAARSPQEVKRDANVAEERYKAHREQARIIEEKARAERARSDALKAEAERKRRIEEAERKRAWAEGEEERARQRAIARAREEQWRREQAEWDHIEHVRRIAQEQYARDAEQRAAQAKQLEMEAKARREAAEEAERAYRERELKLRAEYAKIVEDLRSSAKQNQRLGGGYFIKIVRKNVNIGSGETAIRMEVGEMWEVGEYWMTTLLSDNLAEYVMGWHKFVADQK